MANHLGLDESVSRMVGEWDTVRECSAPVGAPGCVMQIEHHDSVSFSRHSRLIRFWEAELANLVQITTSSTSLKGPESKFSFFMVAYYGPTGTRVHAQLFSSYKLFFFVLVYKVTPHLSNGKSVFLGFFPWIRQFFPPQVSCTPRCSQIKLSNYFIKPLASDKVSTMSSVPISASFRSPDSLRMHLLIDEWPRVYPTHVRLVRYCLYMRIHTFSH